MRNRLTTDFYRRYLAVIMDKLDDTPRPDDILRLSSETIHDLLSEYGEAPLPAWCQSAGLLGDSTLTSGTSARPDDSQALLAPENYRKTVSDGDQGWTLQD